MSTLKVVDMCEIVQAISDIFKVIADNPSSILIVIGSLFIIITVFVPLQIVSQILLGGLGLLMLIMGIILNLIWLQS